ncbi:unnamed protein product [Pleuronectes platessa]|uniref:Uncharacterized protein n=1 Tax=Pleuronectes platessa TaxID=8262 RepID=A0A9N7TMK6_PLEPL|nr:unnamed protein product [Pleuronectes platessa]
MENTQTQGEHRKRMDGYIWDPGSLDSDGLVTISDRGASLSYPQVSPSRQSILNPTHTTHQGLHSVRRSLPHHPRSAVNATHQVSRLPNTVRRHNDRMATLGVHLNSALLGLVTTLNPTQEKGCMVHQQFATSSIGPSKWD